MNFNLPHSRKYRLSSIIGGLLFLSMLNSSLAQLPGNIHIGIGGRGFNLQGNVPVDKIKELFKPGEARFDEAVLKGDVDRAARWVKPEFVDKPIKGFPPIYYAAVQGNTYMVKLLDYNGASKKHDFNGRSLAYVAASYGHTDTAELFVSLGGGRESDVSQGHALYAANEAERRRESKAATAFALGVVEAMLSSSSSDASAGESDSQRNWNHIHEQVHAIGDTNSVYY